jgi:hypothetical protein
MDMGRPQIGDEASMLAHIHRHTGIWHLPYDRVVERDSSGERWKPVVWKTWSLATPHRHGKVPKARMAL